MDFRGDRHFRRAIPQVQHFAIIPKADLPLIGARAERERRKSVRKNMDAGSERKFLGGAGPHQLALGIEEGDAVLAAGDGLGQFDSEIDGDRTERREGAKSEARRFPSEGIALWFPLWGVNPRRAPDPSRDRRRRTWRIRRRR